MKKLYVFPFLDYFFLKKFIYTYILFPCAFPCDSDIIILIKINLSKGYKNKKQQNFLIMYEESCYNKHIISEMINIKKQKNSLNLQTDTI